LETKRGWGVGVGSSILGGGVKIANFCSELLKKNIFMKSNMMNNVNNFIKYIKTLIT
jgi:hypothetical protein